MIFDYYPTHIANYFISKKKEPDYTIDNYKLNKLVYFAYGYSLAILDKEIFGESIQAWRYGPVIPSIYHEFKRFGVDYIKEPAIHFSETNRKRTVPKVDPKDKKTINILETIYQKYGSCSKEDFKKMIHRKNSPWEICYLEGKDYVVIDKREIKRYFKDLLPLEFPSKKLKKVLDQTDADMLSGEYKNYPFFDATAI